MEAVRRDRQALGLGDGGYLAQLRQAAAHRVRLQDRDGRRAEESAHVIAGGFRRPPHAS